MKSIKNVLKEFVNHIDMLNTINGGVSLTAVQVEKAEKELIISVSAPSVQPEAFDIVLSGNQLVIHSYLPPTFEQPTDEEDPLTIPMFYKSFDLPAIVDSERIEAVFEEGRLRVHLPFKDWDQMQRHIDIQLN